MELGDESIHSDIMLDVPKTLESTVLSLDENTLVDFVGTLKTQGGAFSDHVIAVEEIRTR